MGASYGHTLDASENLDCPTCLTPTLTVTEPGGTHTAADTTGCDDSMFVDVFTPSMPQQFHPDNDGLNDVFRAEATICGHRAFSTDGAKSFLRPPIHRTARRCEWRRPLCAHRSPCLAVTGSRVGALLCQALIVVDPQRCEESLLLVLCPCTYLASMDSLYIPSIDSRRGVESVRIVWTTT